MYPPLLAILGGCWVGNEVKAGAVDGLTLLSSTAPIRMPSSVKTMAGARGVLGVLGGGASVATPDSQPVNVQ